VDARDKSAQAGCIRLGSSKQNATRRSRVAMHDELAGFHFDARDVREDALRALARA
jgi:hypothetical protein